MLSSSNFKNMMETGGTEAASDIIENFLNGHYMEFQLSLDAIAHQLRFDPFFGHKLHHLVATIRKKALI